jgi:glycosyltransferase involved in cell wall biosynthesis
MSGARCPKVSVIVPFRDSVRYLRLAVESVLADQRTPLEVIAVDDGSCDGSAGTLADLPVEVISCPTTQGPGYARNLGIARARGEYITFLDSDDLMHPEAMSWRVDYLDRHPEEQIVGGRLAGNIDAHGHPFAAPGDHAPPQPRLTLDYMRRGGAPTSCCWLYLYRRALLERLRGFDPQWQRGAEDVDLLVRVLAVTSIPCFDLPVVHYRWHAGGMSKTQVGAALQPSRITLAQQLLVLLTHGLPVPVRDP